MDELEQNVIAAAATVGAYDAKSRLSELLDRVERGEQIIITRHGKPIARLVPEGGHDRDRARAAVRRIRALRAKLAARGVDLTDAEIRALRDEGRR
jgi:prevent-host-death family protein